MPYQQTAPLLTADEEVELARAIEAGREAQDRLDRGTPAPNDARILAEGRRAKDAFVEANVRLVLSIASRTRIPAHVDRQDVIQDGMIGLNTAVERFDWRRGYKFSTYGTWWIRQGIQRGLENTATAVRIPSHKASELRSTLAVDPESATLSASLRSAARFSSVDSLERVVVDALTVGDGIAGEEPSPDDAIDAGNDQRAAHRLVTHLDPTTRAMVIERFGLDGAEPRTYTAMAEDRGVTPEAVRRRVLRALQALRPKAVEMTAADSTLPAAA